MRNQLAGATVVITGASSGIGRATAQAFAAEGARLVLASRSLPDLETVAEECRSLGGQALAVAADMGEVAQVQALADAAQRWGGRIDVWVNNAGVAAFGPFLDTPVEAHDQVIRTNLLGYLHGAHAVLPTFRRQGSGVLINVISMAGYAPTPLAASYSASKFGDRGLAEALRVEAQAWGGAIHICDLYPAFVDTPMLEHTGNYSGRVLKPVPPVIPVERVARRIVALARHPRPKTAMGVVFPVAVTTQRLAPWLFRWIGGKGAEAYRKLMPHAALTDAGVFKPSPGSRAISGGLRSPGLRLVTGAAGMGLAMAGLALLLRKRSARQGLARKQREA